MYNSVVLDYLQGYTTISTINLKILSLPQKEIPYRLPVTSHFPLSPVPANHYFALSTDLSILDISYN